MLAWIAYILILTAVLGIAALGIEQLSRRGGWATRWGWASAIAASLLIPVVLLVTPRDIAPQSMVDTTFAVMSAEGAVDVVPDSSVPATMDPMLPDVSLDDALIAAWTLLSALVLAVFALSWLRLRRAARSWTRTRVAGREVFVDANLGPAVVGFFPARIVLPRWMLQAEASVQRMTVLHEGEHLAARDSQLILAALVCIAAMPWNLPLWWLLQRLRTAVEVDCDARVLRSGEDVVTYGGALLEVASSNARTPLLAPALIEPATQLEKRIVLLGSSARTISTPLAAAAAVALIGIAGGAMAQIAAPKSLRTSSIATSKASAAAGAELLDAVLEGDTPGAVELIDAGADLDYRRSRDGTPLIVAARYGYAQLVELLIAKGADVNLESLRDGNPLIAAAASGHERIVTMLVAGGANVNAFVEYDETPLINAAQRGHLNVVKYLVGQGADVNFSTIANKPLRPERRSALSEAEKHGHHDVADYLRANGARS
ncbi:MAG TPA: M56 family metallopeptidase [Steroidobacter sp.]|uniref:M56 family metallopeptidase n=1 Tax=Steroidobacter sp. TaxID=1978227 RepID=UPI002ED8D4E1